jgi:hypothetical protein
MLNSLIQQAADVNTHPSILLELAKKNSELARIVATNPNTPVEELVFLGADYPSELINNPIFPLLILENPNLFQEMPVETLNSIVQLDDVPEEYLVMAASRNDYDVLTIIANHVKAAKSLLSQIIKKLTGSEKYCDMESQNIAYIASQNVNYAGEINEGWEEEAWQAIKKYTFLLRTKEKEEFLYNTGILDERLLLGLFPETHLNIIENYETPIYVAELIINKYSPEAKVILNLSQTNISDEYINKSINFNDRNVSRILAAIAINPNVPLLVLEKLACMDSLVIRQAIHRNYNIPNSIQEILHKPEEINLEENQRLLQLSIKNYFDQESYYLRHPHIHLTSKLLFLYENIDDENWKKLERVRGFDILISVARHPKAPVYILEHIYDISKHHKKDTHKITKLKNTLRILLARHSQAPINLLLKLVEDNYFQVSKEAIIRLNQLEGFNSPSPWVACFALGSKSPSQNLIANCELRIANWFKTYFALYNQQVIEFLRNWEHANNPATPQYILSNIANLRSTSLCSAVAHNPNTSADTLHKLAFLRNHDILIGVAKNPNTSIETLLSLSRKRKGFFKIRSQAIKNLIQKAPQTAGAILADFVRSKEATSPRFILLLHPIAPPEFLAQHINSICWLDRYAIAQNPSTPQHVLLKLTADANRLVRAVAREKLSKL